MHRHVHSKRGTVLVLAALSLVMLIGVVALCVDLGILYLAAQQAQDTADAAALAAVGKLRYGMDPEAATAEAIKVAGANKVIGLNVTLTSADVQVGAWDDVNKQVIAWDPTATTIAVKVTVRRTQNSPNGPIPTYFARVMGIQYMQVTKISVAGVSVMYRARNGLNLMIVQDGSSSFQSAWSQAIDADTELLKLINGVSITGDRAGMVTFNANLPDSYLQQVGLLQSYRQYPEINQGIKYTTNSSGRPRKTTDEGVSHSGGQVRPMVGALTDFDTDDHTQLVTAMKKATKLLKNGIAWGDTDTAVGLNYAIDRLEDVSEPDAQKVIVLISDGMPHDVRGASYTEQRKLDAIAAADRAATAGIRIHTVTLQGTEGADFEFNEGLIRNGGYGLRAADASKLRDLLISVGTIEIGHSSLLK